MCEAEIFEFPGRHYFNTMIEHFVVRKREGHVEPETDECSFKILLPNFAHKNPAFFRYLSEVKEAVLKAEIKEYYDWVVKDRIKDLMKIQERRADGSVKCLDRQQCTLVLIDEYGFNKGDADSFDRIYKLYSRYKQTIRQQNFRGKKKTEKIKC